MANNFCTDFAGKNYRQYIIGETNPVQSHLCEFKPTSSSAFPTTFHQLAPTLIFGVAHCTTHHSCLIDFVLPPLQ